MASLQWITHNGKKVLLLDFTQRSGVAVEQLAREVQQVITAQPRDSLLVLADFTGVTLSEEAGRQIAKAAAADRPYVTRTAWVGAFPEALFHLVRDYSQRDIHRFATREEALLFLTADGEGIQ